MGNIDESMYTHEVIDGGETVIHHEYRFGHRIKTSYFDAKTTKIHRLDGPASITYYTNGDIDEEIWYFQGEKHREDGPALIKHAFNKSKYRFYYLYDERIGNRTVFNRKIKPLIERIRADRNFAIINCKHESRYIRELCKEVLNG